MQEKEKNKVGDADETMYVNGINPRLIKFVDLTADSQFKRVFATRGNEDMLLMLLNSILPEKHIRKISLREQDQIPDNRDERKSIFDINCESEDGQQFIIELQKANQKNFSKRLFYYSTFEPRAHIMAGEKDFDFPPIYVIGILDFILNDRKPNDRVVNRYNITNRDDQSVQLFEGLTYVTVELPKLNTDASLLTKEEMVLYTIHNSGRMQSRPTEFRGSDFDKLFRLINFASMCKNDQMTYLAELNEQLVRNEELQAALETGLNQGREEGRAEGEAKKALQTAAAFKAKGIDLQIIAECTGLTIEQIQQL